MVIDDARLTKSCKNMHVSRFITKYDGYEKIDNLSSRQKKTDNAEKIREADELEESKITTLCGTK